MSILLRVIRRRLSRPVSRSIWPRRRFRRRFVGGCTLAYLVVGLFGWPLPHPDSWAAELVSAGRAATVGNHTVARQSSLREVLRNLLPLDRSACCCGQEAQRAGHCCCRKTTAFRPSACCTKDSAAGVSVSRPIQSQSDRLHHPAWVSCGCDATATGMLTCVEPCTVGPSVGIVVHPVPQDGPTQTAFFYHGPFLTLDPPHPRFLSFNHLS